MRVLFFLVLYYLLSLGSALGQNQRISISHEGIILEILYTYDTVSSTLYHELKIKNLNFKNKIIYFPSCDYYETKKGNNNYILTNIGFENFSFFLPKDQWVNLLQILPGDSVVCNFKTHLSLSAFLLITKKVIAFDYIILDEINKKYRKTLEKKKIHHLLYYKLKTHSSIKID